jgi:hypothetical protein
MSGYLAPDQIGGRAYLAPDSPPTGGGTTLVSADLAGAYTLAAFVHADLIGAYSVASPAGLTLVHADLAGAYGVAAFVHADLVGAYSVGDTGMPTIPSSRTVVFGGGSNTVRFQ